MFASFALVSFALAGSATPIDRPTPRFGSKLFAIQADKLLLGDGRTVENGVVLVEDRVIRAVGAGVEIPEDAATITHHGVVSAGLIALHAYTGVIAEGFDPTRAVLDADLAQAFDPSSPDFESVARAGITSLVLTPPPEGLSAGLTTVVKSSGNRIVKRGAHLAIGVGARTLSSDRFPTSWSGASVELASRFEKKEGTFGKAASGKLPVLFEVSTKQDVARAIELAKRFDLAGALYGAEWAGELAPAIKDARLSVIAGPFDAGVDGRHLSSVVALADAGVPFGFGLESPWADPEALRFSAALCVKAGLATGAAWRALSSGAAEIAGVADKVGRLDRGLDADLVFWTGDPLDLRSSVVAVYIDGQRVHGAER